MRIQSLPDHIQQFAAENPHVKIEVSITVDPLVPDELEREFMALPMVRRMEGANLRDYAEAELYFLESMFENIKSNGSKGSKVRRAFSEMDDAKELVAKAFATTNSSERQSWAREALNLSPLCAEAYIVLAEPEAEPDRKIQLLERGIEIAFTQIDQSRFQQPDGYFWEKITTRPYMRCRTALALTLWQHGRKQEAVGQMKELLRLSPGDSQGLRFHLVNWLLEVNDPEADEYCAKYAHCESAFVQYACVLQKFRRHGDSKQSRKELDAAIKANKFVPAVLCDRASVPNIKASRVVRGSAQEAIAYSRIGAAAWRGTDGALDWLSKNCSPLLQSKTTLRKIACAEDYKHGGTWVSPILMDLS